MKKGLLLFLSTTFITLGLTAQSFRAERFTGQDGLSLKGVMHIMQDEQGFLWFRTDDGIVRYDGYHFKSFPVDPNNPHGLFQKVNDIYQDALGNIWVNYDGNGLSFFDKEYGRFTNYKPDDIDPIDIRNQDVQTFCSDSLGNIWIGTTEGLYYYEKEKNQFRQYNPEFKKPVIGLFIDNIGNTWVGTGSGLNYDDGFGLYLIDSSTGEMHLIKGGNAKCSYFLQDSKGRIWMGTNQGLGKVDDYAPGVSPLSQTRFVTYSYATGSISDTHRAQIISLLESSNGDIWFGTHLGIGRAQKSTDNSIRLEYYEDDERFMNSNGQNSFPHLIEDVEGRIWTMGRNAGTGLSVYDESSNTFRTKILQSNFEHGAGGNIGLTLGKNNILWAGTEHEGLIKIDLEQKKFTTFNYDRLNPNSPGSNHIFGFTQGINGHIYIGTAKGVTEYDPMQNNFKRYDLSNSSINSDIVFSTLVDSKGSLWLGHSPNQVSKINPNTWKNDAYKYIMGTDTTGFFAWSVSDILEDSEGHIWIGSHSQGIWEVFGGPKDYTRHNVTLNEKEHKVAIEKLFYDENDRLWIGTSYGLFFFNRNTNRIEPFEIEENGKPFRDGIFSILKDQDLIWLGTQSAGLVKIDLSKQTLSRYNKGTALDGKSIRSIIKHKNDLWMGSNYGLIKFNINNQSTQIYLKEDGLLGNEFSKNSYLVSADGTFYFGGTAGFVKFKPDEIKDNTFEVAPQITNVKLFNQNVGVGDTINDQVVLPKDLGALESLTLNHKNNIISFEFASMHLIAPTKNKYAYMLEGLEEDWNYVDADRRIAAYTSLPSGEYKFKVRATNNDGLWSEQIASMNIVILPPWWDTPAFKLVVLILLFALTYFLYVLRVQSIRQSNKELERLVDEKMEDLKRQNEEIQAMADQLHEVDQSKIKFFMNVSHEFRTPLTLILGPVANLLKSHRLKLEDIENAKLIERNGHRLLRLTNQLLDSSDLERDALKLKVAHGDIVDYIGQIVHAFDFRADSLNINYEFSTNIQTQKGWFDGDKLEKILYNLISNAIKFTGENGRVGVNLTVQNDELVVNVEDDGIGMSQDDLERIFERYFQIDDMSQRRTGTGIGLNFAKKLALKHKGDLKVSSELGKGSTFTLTLPIGEASYMDSEMVKSQVDVSERIDHIQKLFSYDPIIEPDPMTVNRELPIVLLVEDSVDMRAYIKNNLQAEFAVFEAHDGGQGLKMAKKIMPDLIVSDVMMPVMDGLEFCSKVKEDESMGHIPVILLTAKIDEEGKIDGYTIGADEYLTKPIDIALLKVRIENLIRTRASLRDSFSSGLDLLPDNLNIDRADEPFLNKAIRIVEDNLSNPDLSLREFVDELGISKSQLYNRINKLTGQSLNIFIRTVRLKVAAKMIAERDLTFAEIAYKVGFSDANYFSKCFKKQYAQSPRAYQESLQD
ncbi:MAG: response regulator [Cyclobacteriaceae bacterium]